MLVEPAPTKRVIDRSNRLRPQQRAFVAYYLQLWKGGDAAKRAGYTGDVNVQASKLLTNPKIMLAIEQRLQELESGARETIVRVSKIARGDIGNFFDFENKTWKLDSPESKANSDLIKELETDEIIKVDKDGNETRTIRTRLKLHDALAAQTLLMKHHNLLAQDTPPPGGSVTNNTLIIASPEQANSAGIDVAAVAQEMERLRNKWAIQPSTGEIEQIDSSIQDVTDDTLGYSGGDITDDSVE